MCRDTLKAQWGISLVQYLLRYKEFTIYLGYWQAYEQNRGGKRPNSLQDGFVCNGETFSIHY